MIEKKISVIIPNYNNMKYIEKCLESIINQTYKNFEIIFIDDGSNDDSVEIAEKLLRKNQNIEYRIIEQYNQNASVARNRGIEIATGEYAYFLDSDDIVENSNIFEILINEIEDNDLIIGNYNIIDENGDKIGEYKYKSDINDFEGSFKYCTLSPNPSNKFYNLRIIKNNNIYFSNVRIGQDLNFYLKYLLFCKNIKLLDISIYQYRFFQNNMSNAINLRILDIYESINEVKKFYEKNNNLDKYRAFITTTALKNYHVQLAKVYKFKDKKAKNLIYSYFDYVIKLNDKIAISNKHYKEEWKKYKFKKALLKLNMYSLYKKRKDKLNKVKDNKINIIITIILSHINVKWASAFFYKSRLGKKLNLKNPVLFNEKLMWLKLNLYNNNKKIWKLVDKYQVREYLLTKGIKKENLPQIINKYDSVDEIKWNELPEKFALKCTHGCGFNIICEDKGTLDIKTCERKLKKWIKIKFGYRTAETHYMHQKPCIICEKFIEGNNDGFPWDYKVYCFNGKPKVILVCTDREQKYKVHFYDENWNKLLLRDDQEKNDIEKPQSLTKMLDISKKISNEFPFVRIDFYEQNGEPIVGELTFTPSSCTAKYNEYGDKYLGDLLDISNIIDKGDVK